MRLIRYTHRFLTWTGLGRYIRMRVFGQLHRMSRTMATLGEQTLVNIFGYQGPYNLSNICRFILEEMERYAASVRGIPR